MHFTSGLKILNPGYDDWLSIGDGTYEIAWEFYRNTQFPYWLIGDLSSYGLSMARPSFYILPTFYTFPLRLFSFFLGERFQFVGIILLFNFILHFYFSFKIFVILKLSYLNSLLSSTLLLLSPVLVSRYIEQTHYLLTSHWIILASIYFFITKEKSPIRWFILSLSSVLIFPYYAVIFMSILIFFLILNYLRKNLSEKSLIKIIISVLFSFSFSGLVSGLYFYQQVLEPDYRIFSANLNSLINPRGWSALIENRVESVDSYEGFAFIGLHFLILILIVMILLLFKRYRSKLKQIRIDDFYYLVIPSLLLLFLSLTNEIYFDEKLIFELPYTLINQYVEVYFRSPGRFIWLFSYFFMISTLVLLNILIKKRLLALILITVTFVGYSDMKSMLTSARNTKFNTTYSTPLISPIWSKINSCYDKIYSVPPVTSAKLLYPIARKAAEQNIAIFPAAIPRVSPMEQDSRQREIRRQFKLGEIDPRAFYVFQDADTVPEQITRLNLEFALNTMSKTSRGGVVDGISVIAPDVERCKEFFGEFASALPIKNQDQYISDLRSIDFSNANSRKHLVTGWSETEKWGVWTNDYWSEVLVEYKSNFRLIEIKGHRYEISSSTYPPMQVYINGNLVFEAQKSDFLPERILIENFELTHDSDTYLIELRFTDLVSPRNLKGENDDRLLGFALESISFID